MDTVEFLGLKSSHNPFRWHLEVVPHISTSLNFLFGGCGLAAAISAMEATTGRNLIWATAQYLSYARPGEVMDIDVTVSVSGHQMTQARAVCHVGEREILTVNAALGDRPLDMHGQFETMPGVPSPGDCPLFIHRGLQEGSINERIEKRLVKGRQFAELDKTVGDGQTLMWARIPGVIQGVDASALAVLGDYIPLGVSQAMGIRGGGNSLDNTLRVVRLVPTEWVLLDIRIHAIDRGFAHGLVHMYAEDGTLMATASQSCIVRFWKDEVPTDKEVS
jgi:acyl-CoA thioesterase-2